jgi:hypothetical protein
MITSGWADGSLIILLATLEVEKLLLQEGGGQDVQPRKRSVPVHFAAPKRSESKPALVCELGGSQERMGEKDVAVELLEVGMVRKYINSCFSISRVEFKSSRKYQSTVQASGEA